MFLTIDIKMKNLILLVIFFCSIHSLTAKAEIHDLDGGPITAVNRLCPTVIWDSWIIDNVRYNKGLNQIEIIVKHDWNKNVVNMTENQALEFAEFFIENIYEGYYGILNEDYGEGDFMMYLTLGTLFKQMYKERCSLKLSLIFNNGKLATDQNMIVGWKKLSPRLYGHT